MPHSMSPARSRHGGRGRCDTLPPMTREVGSTAAPERIGRYELLLPIGTGGMGAVFLARTEIVPGMLRDVAVKLMHPQLRADGDLARQFLCEARLAAGIRHPNVVSVLEAGETPHGVYLAMDYVEGDTLAAVVRAALKRDGSLPLPIAARILHDALTGLHAAHERCGEDGRPLGLVHRDFSPQNILVGSDGISRLTDFGIAKALSEVGATATGIVKGKVGYMAPEQARGLPIDRRCDVWAAGVVAWEAIAGRRLFRGPNDTATLLMVVSGQPPPLVSSRRPEARALDAVIAAALEARPEQRTATALAFRQHLEAGWRQIGGLADHEEVARFVTDLVGDTIATRRSRAQEVLGLRSRIASVNASAEAIARENDASSLGDSPIAMPEDATVVDRRAASSVPPPPPRNRRSWLFAAGAAALLVGGGLAAATTRSTSEPATASLPATAAPPVEVPIQAPSAPAPERSILRVLADSPVAQLRLGDRDIVLAEPVNSPEIALSADERGRALTLRAIARDGRRTELQLEPDQREVRVTFPAPAPAAVPPPAVRRPIRPEPTSGPGLADSPYGQP